MTINPDKSKCVTFSIKNKRNKKDVFNIGTTELENVTEYTYLGLEINVTGSFQNSLDMLSENLNNKAKLKQIPVKTALRLFDAVVLPILTYGSEAWALHLTLDHDKWNKTTTEGTHLNFLKHILGIDRSTNTIICRAELGRYPVSIDINTRIINFYKHVRNMPKDTIIHQTYLLDETLKQNGITGALAQHIKNTGHIYNPEILSFPKSSIKKMF